MGAVISSALSSLGAPISAFTISVLDHKGDVLLSIDQRFPLPEEKNR